LSFPETVDENDVTEQNSKEERLDDDNVSDNFLDFKSKDFIKHDTRLQRKPAWMSFDNYEIEYHPERKPSTCNAMLMTAVREEGDFPITFD